MMKKRLFVVLAALFVALSLNATTEAKWIGCTYPGDVLKDKTKLPARYLRKEAELKGGISSAVLKICGLGVYDAWINGDCLTADQELSPTVSDARIRVYYNEFEVSKFLRKGMNAFAVSLGNGRFQSMREPGMRGFGLPMLWMVLDVTFKDGSSTQIVSDESWKITCEGPIRANNEFDGEIYDARKELTGWTELGYDDSKWAKASLLDAPAGKLCLQPNPNIAVQDIVNPVSIVKRGESYFLDMGQNMVGRLRIKAKGLNAGDSLSLRFAELLTQEGELYLDNLRTAKVTDTYVAKDAKPFCWQPQYVYHGFRFVEIKGLKVAPKLSDFEGQVMYDKMAVLGHFETSNEMVNRIYHNAFWGIRGNYRGMPTDCPQRDERLGWMGDRTMGCYGESYIFDNHALYSKWLVDIQDAQNNNGSIPDVAPRYWTIHSDNMTWPGVIVTASDMLLQRFGDDEPIVEHYDAIAKWLKYMKRRYCKDGIMLKDRYGDWCMPPESLELIHSQDETRITPGPAISTPFYYFILNKMANFAKIAGHPEDVEYYETEAAATKKAYNEKYLNADFTYANNTVTANLLPLYFGMVPSGKEQAVFANVVKKTEVDCDSHVSCGVIGIMVLMRTLTEYGRPDLALKVATNETYPGWGYMVKNGATTIWELWNGNTADPAMNSGNHVMLLGDLVVWFYEYLAGIRPEEPGYKAIELKPYPVKGLDWVNASYDSPFGEISSSWKVSKGKFVWNVEVPKGTTAKAYVPQQDGTRKMVELTAGKHKLTSDLSL